MPMDTNSPGEKPTERRSKLRFMPRRVRESRTQITLGGLLLTLIYLLMENTGLIVETMSLLACIGKP